MPGNLEQEMPEELPLLPHTNQHVPYTLPCKAEPEEDLKPLAFRGFPQIVPGPAPGRACGQCPLPDSPRNAF